MAEYIKREALLEEFDDCFPNLNPYLNTELYSVRKRIETMKAADVVEVVRCKDCEHYKSHSPSVHWHTSRLYCMRTAAVCVKKDDFCSYGKRKEGAEE